MDDCKPILTIGVCAKNSENTISIAIDSILRQNFPHNLMEIIFVNDGSTDNTLKVMQDAAKKTDIKTRIFSGPWQGLGKARNTILFNAHGEYVLWVDSDKILNENFAQKQVDIINNNPKSGIAIGQLGILPGQSTLQVLEMFPYILSCSKNAWRYPYKLPGTCAAIHRLSAAKDIGGFDYELKGTGEDVEFAIRMLQAGWLIEQGNGVFFEINDEMIDIRQLWNKYVNNGCHGRKLYAKKKFISFYKINPFSSFFAGLLFSIDAYRLKKRKIALLLPFYYSFKMMAWLYGFNKINN